MYCECILTESITPSLSSRSWLSSAHIILRHLHCREFEVSARGRVEDRLHLPPVVDPVEASAKRGQRVGNHRVGRKRGAGPGAGHQFRFTEVEGRHLPRSRTMYVFTRTHCGARLNHSAIIPAMSFQGIGIARLYPSPCHGPVNTTDW